VSDFFNRILPTLQVPLSREFNLFDVLHHGTHEKQLSNLFAWLLTAGGSHELGDRFVGWFLDEVDAELAAHGEPPVKRERFAVEQERNTRGSTKGGDIADIVLRGRETALVVENFYVSDGHGHDYTGYMTYGQSLTGNRSVVVMLCEIEDRSRLTDGWQMAPVVLYRNLIRRLSDYLASNPDFAQAHPEQAAFFGQMRSHFLKGMQMDEAASLEFVRIMCETGEAKRYGNRTAETAFGEFVREEAEHRFVDGQAVLNSVKRTLQRYLSANLQALNARLGADVFEGTDIGLAGIYQWDVSLKTQGKRSVYVMFGPSAWTDNERDAYKAWDVKIDEPDYSRLFIGYSGDRALRQSTVTMADVLGEHFAQDTRLLDEIVETVRTSGH
jgi:hypothetical protein